MHKHIIYFFLAKGVFSCPFLKYLFHKNKVVQIHLGIRKFNVMLFSIYCYFILCVFHQEIKLNTFLIISHGEVHMDCYEEEHGFFFLPSLAASID